MKPTVLKDFGIWNLILCTLSGDSSTYFTLHRHIFDTVVYVQVFISADFLFSQFMEMQWKNMYYVLQTVL